MVYPHFTGKESEPETWAGFPEASLSVKGRAEPWPPTSLGQIGAYAVAPGIYLAPLPAWEVTLRVEGPQHPALRGDGVELGQGGGVRHGGGVMCRGREVCAR